MHKSLQCDKIMKLRTMHSSKQTNMIKPEIKKPSGFVVNESPLFKETLGKLVQVVNVFSLMRYYLI